MKQKGWQYRIKRTSNGWASSAALKETPTAVDGTAADCGMTQHEGRNQIRVKFLPDEQELNKNSSPKISKVINSILVTTVYS